MALLKVLRALPPHLIGATVFRILRNGMSSRRAEQAAAAAGIEAMGLHRFVLNRPDPKGLLLGFAAFDERAIRAGVADLAAALEA
jgi:GntR family transcriptional regulator/MocR family aminotransferase